MPGQEPWDSDEHLLDGTSTRLRLLRATDDTRVHDLCEHTSQRSLYFRFFTAMPAERAGDIEM